MPLNKESTLVKKMFSNQLSLMNGHHSTAVVMYKCAKRDQIVIGAGVKVKKRLEYLLENDIELRTAIQEDEDDMNRARSRRYVDVVPAQAYGRSRANQPPNKLDFPLKYYDEREAQDYLSHLCVHRHQARGGKKDRVKYGAPEFKPESWPEHICRWDRIKKFPLAYDKDEFRALGFRGTKSEALKEIISHILQHDGFDPETYVVEDLDHGKLDRKKVRRGERNVQLHHTSSSSSEPESQTLPSNRSTGPSSHRGFQSSFPQRFRMSQGNTLPAPRPTVQVQGQTQSPGAAAAAYHRIMASHATSTLHTVAPSQPPLPSTQPPLPSSQPPLPSSQPPLPSSQPPLPLSQPSLPPSHTPTPPSRTPSLSSISFPYSALSAQFSSSGSSQSSTNQVPPLSSGPLPFIPQSPLAPTISSPTVFTRTRSQELITDADFRQMLNQPSRKSRKR